LFRQLAPQARDYVVRGNRVIVVVYMINYCDCCTILHTNKI